MKSFEWKNGCQQAVYLQSSPSRRPDRKCITTTSLRPKKIAKVKFHSSRMAGKVIARRMEFSVDPEITPSLVFSYIFSGTFQIPSNE